MRAAQRAAGSAPSLGLLGAPALGVSGVLVSALCCVPADWASPGGAAAFQVLLEVLLILGTEAAACDSL